MGRVEIQPNTKSHPFYEGWLQDFIILKLVATTYKSLL